MKNLFLGICGLLWLAGCTASQSALYQPKSTEKQWSITAKKAPVTNMVSIVVNDNVVVEAKPPAFSNTIDAKGTYEGHEVRFFSVYNNGIMGIFGAGWETTVLVDNELAARFKL